MRAMAETGNAEGVRSAILDLLRGFDDPRIDVAARIIGGEVSGVSVAFKPGRKRPRGRPWSRR